ncbi:MAG: SMC-Scp complex subunit ScpB [Candidatus Omnitrophica bacterium]|nr:SMC-Scp complex subunit ScpB [Candidatus Omnitrophota bacterium]
MSKVTDQQKEKEKEEHLKALREELSKEIADQLPSEFQTEKRGASKSEVSARPIQDESEAKQVVEAILFTAGKPVTVNELKRALSGWPPAKIEKLISDLKAEYEREGRSFQIQEIAGGYECATDPKYAPWILKLDLQRKAKQATQSALETLAILAYKQPVTRAEIEDLRGVDASGVLATLLERNLIKIVGKKEVPGRPFLYGTTEKFLEHFGLKTIQALPDISEIRSLIDHSVKREGLLRTEQVISNEEPKQEEGSDTHES